MNFNSQRSRASPISALQFLFFFSFFLFPLSTRKERDWKNKFPRKEGISRSESWSLDSFPKLNLVFHFQPVILISPSQGWSLTSLAFNWNALAPLPSLLLCPEKLATHPNTTSSRAALSHPYACPLLFLPLAQHFCQHVLCMFISSDG